MSTLFHIFRNPSIPKELVLIQKCFFRPLDRRKRKIAALKRRLAALELTPETIKLLSLRCKPNPTNRKIGTGCSNLGWATFAMISVRPGLFRKYYNPMFNRWLYTPKLDWTILWCTVLRTYPQKKGALRYHPILKFTLIPISHRRLLVKMWILE